MKDLFLFSDLIYHSHSFVYVFHFLLVVVLIVLVAKMSSSKMQLVPSGVQNIVEAYLEGVMSMSQNTLGSEKLARKYLPLVATIGLVVFFGNAIGIIPGFESPTSSLNLTLTLALIVFFYYHFEGIRENGFFKYFKHFMGPSKILAPLMFPIEIISHISRIISLSFRLFGNIKGDDLFLLVMLTLAPFFAPLPAYALLTLMAVLQAFIFMMLTLVYLAGAVAIEEH
ncbi:F0F1 ATP synthase subunit A [Campylobacter pinnipediorum]|uniref:ATP synthase subunit a n=1 Tax=Campylobacter pinnipediorum subsp. pinnipediorum TaxID=1660067 RepID=A0AAX0LAH8_9BACT|nr:F0F1 ATP synthase subunit A [Campylobacter pinnipediorum]AQW80999.1 ATP synthase, F0 complex, a subunit [Campylobacter pinnipediorum subsp. pinnipediorum]AQW82615.1 ATP synthase, F0 complex, a subunit [Campylobacter pinnipediorum subsp. pinnipediorum]AQW84301.1 ATP synthase, F0 complex, a subunit [Campylobacter pinnipediorum subsp. pinnipediorum]OPA77115.1 F0F1 ATP synthase subunit A [Campylobacter pinnipediorum subsp. pinnipediorum]OPA78902.1 F0F1 ATP synthase subunit A [Campylobacter pinn